MMRDNNSISLPYKEIIFQVVLYILVFLFYSFDKNQPQIQEHQLFFFLNYALATFFISYGLLPRFFYQKKYLHFFLSLFLTIGAVILIEELVLEKIYFPDTRGKKFYNVFYTLLDVMPVILILSGFKFAWDALGKQRQVDELKAMIKESELQFLKSQINPHFLFNNLNNLYSYAITNSPKTPQIILELSAVLRYMLYECKADYVPITKEVKQLENFVNLSELQIEERGTVSYETKNIQSSYQIAPLILIVFIENAFKHSTASQSDNISIAITIELAEDGVLIFNCKNSFLKDWNTYGMSEGIGLKNVVKRLELMYPDRHQLEFIEGGGEFEVRLTIQLGTKN